MNKIINSTPFAMQDALYVLYSALLNFMGLAAAHCCAFIAHLWISRKGKEKIHKLET